MFSSTYQHLLLNEEKYLKIYLALKVMASPLIYLGRAVFFILMIIQGVFLASYPAKYEHQIGWYGIFVLYLPALLVWSCILRTT